MLKWEIKLEHINNYCNIVIFCYNEVILEVIMNNVGLKKGQLEIMDYMEEYHIIYEKEKEELLKLYGDRITSIDHVGSTSIKGIKSKPIIDIIDSILGRHYHFSEAELDFIINYDAKFRIEEID